MSWGPKKYFENDQIPCEKSFGFVNAQVMGTVILNQNVGFCLINDMPNVSYRL